MGQINTNRTFLETKRETIHGDGGADVSAGATLNPIADLGVIAALVQPTGPRLLKITVTDGDVSINAFQIDAIGTDPDGNPVTQQFLFAGGLIQTGTAKFSGITSITVTSVVGEGAGDTLAVSWVSPAMLIPILDGDYSVGLDDPLREQQHVVGDQDSQYMVQDVRNLGGDLKVGMWPHLSRYLMDLAAVRVGGEVGSFAARWVIPGVETRLHKGLKVDRLTIEGNNGGDITASMGLIGLWEETEGVAAYPGSYVIPAINSLLFKNARFIVSLDAGASFGNRIQPVGVESFSVSLMNGLKIGPAIEDRINAYKDGRPEFITAGRRKVDLRYQAAFDRLAYSTMQRNRLRTQFKLVGAHQGYSTYATVAAGPYAAGANVNIQVDSSAGFAVGEYVYLDNAGTTNLPSVGRVSVIPDGTHLTIATLDEAVATADHVFHAGIEIKTGPALVQNSTPDKPFDDFLKVTVNAQIFSGGSDPLPYKVLDIALP